MQRFDPIRKAAADPGVRVRDVGRGGSWWTGEFGQRVQKDVIKCVEAEIEKVLDSHTSFGALVASFERATLRGTVAIYADQKHPQPDGQIPVLKTNDLKHDGSLTKTWNWGLSVAVLMGGKISHLGFGKKKTETTLGWEKGGEGRGKRGSLRSCSAFCNLNFTYIFQFSASSGWRNSEYHPHAVNCFTALRGLSSDISHASSL